MWVNLVSGRPKTCRIARYGPLAAAPALLVLSTLVGATTSAHAQGSVATNPVSAFPMTMDGQFTGGVVAGVAIGEWSDITPLAFISPTNPSGILLRTEVGDPLANSLLYAGIAPETVGGPVEDLYLMYDYLPRTNPFFSPGEFIADIAFPITLPNQTERFITVQFRGGNSGPTSFDVLVDQNGDGNPDVLASSLGMDGALGFGPSELSSLPHLLIELEVPLRIPAGFGTPGGPFPQAGINPLTGLYDPDPAFWGANIAKNDVDPPASAAIFQILPDGTTIADSTNVVPAASSAAAPEPATGALLAAGLLTPILGAVVRRRRKA